MDGRVERRINNKFYFVLDEVGGSDCESELASEGDTKPASNPPNDIRSVVENDPNSICSLKSDASMETKNFIIKDVTDSSDYKTDTAEKYISEPFFMQKNHFSETDTEENDSKNTNASKPGPDKTPEPVDMDIESDGEDLEQTIKPLVTITFLDENVENLLKTSLFKFFSQKIKECTIIANSQNSLQFEVYDKDPNTLLKSDILDFNLDTKPADRHTENFIHYSRIHDFVLSDRSTESSQDKKIFTSAASCFNCLGKHNLRDCPEAKDFRAINRNRLKFQTQNKSSRYHLDENQKFSHIVPGVISKKLRHALNLHRDQQPAFIYRMRLLGYPPAWLEEAKVSHSGVVLYDNKGVPVLEEDEEEGEILPEGSKDRFDISKIIDFPGFNVPLPSSFKDETKFHHCPAFSHDQSKENLIKLLQPKTVQAYVKKAMPVQKKEENSEKNQKKAPSPTIEEMEETKRQLLMELDDEDSASENKLSSEDNSSIHTSETEVSQNKELGNVKNLEFGTPILKSVSPFSKLPSREQFSVNVSDIINFENLPNSTGKYETMRHVIKKIRISASKSQKE